jgi:hypothetical protein
MKRKRYKNIGEGDNQIDDWGAPISDYPTILSSLVECESANIKFPEEALFKYLKSCDFKFKTYCNNEITTTEDLLIKLLYPFLDIDSESWGGDSPGLSGNFLIARMELGHTKIIRKILSKTEEFLSKWLSEIRIKEIESAKKMQAEKIRNSIQFSREQHQKKTMEEEIGRVAFENLVAKLSGEIRSFQVINETPFLYPDGTQRLLCVQQGPVYVLEYDPYDSEKNANDARLLADNLEKIGFTVLRLKQHQPSGVGNIPYFAGSMRKKYQGWLQAEGVLSSDDPELTAQATKHRAQFLEWRK